MGDEVKHSEGLSALEYINAFGWRKAEAVALAAGTTRNYFSQIAHGHRRPSYELARLLVEKSDNVLSLLKLLEAKNKK